MLAPVNSNVMQVANLKAFVLLKCQRSEMLKAQLKTSTIKLSEAIKYELRKLKLKMHNKSFKFVPGLRPSTGRSFAAPLN